jgi:hypothetical protein
MQKSKAQRILDDIMGSDRYAQVFSDRVFSDEPILRTGASAFRDRDKDRPSTGSVTFVREMSTTPSSGPLGAPQPPRKQIQVTPSSGAFGSPINIEYPSESNGQLKFSSGDHGNPDLPDPWLEDWGAEEAERVIPVSVSIHYDRDHFASQTYTRREPYRSLDRLELKAGEQGVEMHLFYDRPTERETVKS